MVDHPILLRGLGAVEADGAPLLLQRTDQQLIPVLLDQLQAGNLAAVAATRAHSRGDDGRLVLYQPVHRTFYIALFEAVCLLPGLPRVDPQAIDSAGLVVRRRRGNGREGWLAEQSVLRGWVKLAGESAEADPDPALRRLPSAGHALVDRALALHHALTAPLAEQVTPLFVAPSAVCAALGKTVLYGLVPVTSGDFCELPGATTAAPLGDEYAEQVAKHLPNLLRAGQANFPLAGRRYTAADGAPDKLAADATLKAFVATVRQLAVEFDAFGAAAPARELFAELNRVSLKMPGGGRQRMGDFFKQASAVLAEGRPGELIMPEAWPAIDSGQARTFWRLIVTSLTTRLMAGQQGERRFAQTGAIYEIRGFLRVNRQPACPPELVWSDYSEAYTIAPWYAPADTGLPLPQIELPDPFDRNLLAGLRPNVTFKVPEKLFGMLNTMDPAATMDGKKPGDGDGFGLDWLCSFNLPMITICAFLVLNIFLSLFDIVFRWLLLIKICIPIPKK